MRHYTQVMINKTMDEPKLKSSNARKKRKDVFRLRIHTIVLQSAVGVSGLFFAGWAA
jgi:hypothetical protein